MPFIAPKTSWAPIDYFNVEDWNRVVDNLIFVNDWFKLHNWPSAALQSMSLDRGQNSLPYVDLINRLEQNLQRVYEITGINFTEWRNSKTWYARLETQYHSNPNYDDWNRWEQLSKNLMESINYVTVYLHQRISGTFYASADYRIQMLSRGR